jgi:hypothetical protein
MTICIDDAAAVSILDTSDPPLGPLIAGRWIEEAQNLIIACFRRSVWQEPLTVDRTMGRSPTRGRIDRAVARRRRRA